MKKIFLFFFFAATFLLLFIALNVSAARGQSCKYEKNDVRDVPCSFSRVEIKGGAVRKIAGQVLDTNGAVVNNALVVVYKVVTDQTVYVGTQSVDDKGRFCFGKLPTGDYIVKAGAPAFMCADVKVHLAPDDTMVLRSKMQPINLQPGV